MGVIIAKAIVTSTFAGIFSLMCSLKCQLNDLDRSFVEFRLGVWSCHGEFKERIFQFYSSCLLFASRKSFAELFELKAKVDLSL